MTLQIRSIDKSERIIWDQICIDYATFYKTESTPQARDAVWEWIFDDSNNFWCSVAEQNGKVIGFTQFQLMHRSTAGSYPVYLSDLFVDPSVRGSGAGRALIDHVIDFAKNRGFTNVRWLTQEYNYTARKLYDTYNTKSDFILYSVDV